MSNQKKRRVRNLTFIMLPALIIALAILPALLIAEEPADALTTSEWTKVRTALDNYITSQYVPDSVGGESGFVIDAATLKGRMDSNGDGTYLGEGDDAANAPVLVDVLNGGGGGIVQGTSVVTKWNDNTAANNDTTSVANTNLIASKVTNHDSAGFSTDIVSYCLTGHTESVAAGAMGAISQAGGYIACTPGAGGDCPKILDLKWGRYGWNTGSQSFAYMNTLATALPSPGYANAGNSACTGSSPDAELVRCTAENALKTVGSGTLPGNGTGYGGRLVVDIRPGAAGGSPSGAVAVPLNTVFNSGLNDINPGGAEKVAFGRTQHTGGNVAIGLHMLGYDTTFGKWGAAKYNNTIGEAFSGGAGYGLVPNAVNTTQGTLDTTAPSITSGPNITNITATSFEVSRTASEPATSKIEFSNDGGATWTAQANDTILNASKTTTISGLSEYTSYRTRLKVCDGQANCTTSDLGSILTKDVTAPSVSNLAPSGTIYNSFATVSGDLSDAGSGLDPLSLSVTLDGSPLSNCSIAGSGFSCDPVSGLDYGTHSISGSVADQQGNSSPISGSFTVGDNVAPTLSHRNNGDGYDSTEVWVTADYNDPEPSSGIDTGSAEISVDGADATPCTVDDTVSIITCQTSGNSDGTHTMVISISDNDGNTGSTAEGSFVVDITAPLVSNLSPSGTIYTDSTTISGDITENGLGTDTEFASITLDGSPVSGCTVTASSFSCPISGLAYGNHSIGGTIRDLMFNTTNINGSFTVGDNVAPAVSITGPTATDTTGAPTVTGTYSDPAPSSGITGGVKTGALEYNGSTADCTLTATDSTSGTFSCPLSGLTTGSYPLTMTIRDNDDNAGTGTGTLDVNTDAPTITDTYPTGFTADSTPLVGFDYTASTSVDGASLMVDNTPCGTSFDTATSGSATCTPSALPEGTHDVYAVVAVGPNSSNASWSFTTDYTGPAISNTQPASGSYTTDTSPTISADFSDSGSGVDPTTTQVTLDANLLNCVAGPDGVSCPAGTTLADGKHTVVIDVEDKAGNTSEETYSFTVDTTSPTMASLTPSEGSWVTTTGPTIQAVVADIPGSGIDTSSLAIELDGATLTGCTTASGGSVTYTCSASSLAQGEHTVYFYVEDNVGNSMTYNRIFSVDTISPTVSNIQPSGWINTDTLYISADITDPGAGGFSILGWLPAVLPVETGSGVDTSSLKVELATGGNNEVVPGCTTSGIAGGFHLECPAVPGGEGHYFITISGADNAGVAFQEAGEFDVDLGKPTISNPSPTGDVFTSAPVITAILADDTSDIDPASAVVTLDGTPLDGCIIAELTGGISCPTSGLGGGAHQVTMDISDIAGNAADQLSWSFNVARITYYFPFYDNNSAWGMNGDWIIITNESGADDAEVDIYIGSDPDPAASFNAAGGNAIAPGEQAVWQSPVPVSDGPVRVISTNGASLGVSQRVIFKDSFNEIWAVEESQLESKYHFNWYDNNNAWGMNGDWIHVTNVGSGDAEVDFFVGDDTTPVHTETITAGANFAWQADSTMTNGPVRVRDNNGNPLVVSQRVVYGDSFTEMLGIGDSTLENEAWFAWYDNTSAWGMNGDWIMVTNMGDAETAVDVSIGGTSVATLGPISAGAQLQVKIEGDSAIVTGGLQPATTIDWQADEATNNGPVKVSGSQPLLVTQRVVYKNSFEEIPGTYPVTMGTRAYFNWYDLQSLGMAGDWLLAGNTSSKDVNVSMSIGNSALPGNFGAAAVDTTAPLFPGEIGGPARIVCTDCSPGDKLIISQRVIYKNSFNEIVGRPYTPPTH